MNEGTETIKICANVHPYYCPKCGALYFRRTQCYCKNLKGEKDE